jgi:hypothetical protein
MLSDVSGITVETSVDVRLKQGSPQSISLTAQQNLLDIITIEAKNGVCVVDAKECFSSNKEAYLTMTMPRLEMISINGSGSLTGEGTFMVTELSADIRGSGDIVIAVDAQEVSASIEGSGNMDLSGKTLELTASIDGSGDLNASELQAESVEADIRGSGDIDVDVSDELDASIKGSGNIIYRGNPDVKSSISGSGEISRK